MIKSGNYIIIPVEAMSLVVEVKDGKIIPVCANNPGLASLNGDQILNETRRAIYSLLSKERDAHERVNRAYKKYHAVKEFLEDFERDIAESTWKKFNLDDYNASSLSAQGSFEKALFEIADLMLEYNVPIEKIDTDEQQPEFKAIPLDQVKGLLDGLGKKE